jgi:hypothetical protein
MASEDIKTWDLVHAKLGFVHLSQKNWDLTIFSTCHDKLNNWAKGEIGISMRYDVIYDR